MKHRRKPFRWKRLLLALMVFCAIGACSSDGSKSSSGISESSTPSVQAAALPESASKSSSSSTDDHPSSLSSSGSQQKQESSAQSSKQDDKEPYAPGYDFTAEDIPAYSGEPSVVINNNVPFFEEGEESNNAFQNYFDLDRLGRVTLAYASLGPELQPEEERGDISSVHPTGFENEDYPFVDGGKVYNRCHLIAYMLAGQNANPKNLMTGTRSMNVKGMLPYEQKTDDYIDRTGNHVMYRVTPIFKGDDLVAQGVLMEAKSAEDHGAGLQFCVFCYNVEPGVAINYATGANEADGSIAVGAPQSDPQPETQPDPVPAPAAQEPAQASSYVVNTNTGKFHRPDCASVSKMKAKNRQDVTATREELIAQGYTPCQNCNP